MSELEKDLAKDTKEDTNQKHLNNWNQIVKDFALNTTLHGIQSISSSRTRRCQVFWTLCVTLALAYVLKSNVMSVKRYFSYPYTTEVGEEFPGQSGLKFPSITICPENMFVKKKIELHDDNRLFHEWGLNLEICQKTREARQKFNLTCGTFLMCSLDIYSVMSRNCGPGNRLVMSNFLKTKNVSHSYEEQFRDLYGPNLQHSLYECRFGQKKCGAGDFKKLITTYGKCFQFNEDSSNVTYAFGYERLLLILDAKIDEYTKSPFFTEGFRIIIHDQGTYIEPNSGFVVSPGNIASVAIKQKKKTYLPTPYKSNCTKKSLQRYKTYTIQGCISECIEALKMGLCGCRKSGYIDSSIQGIRVCGANDSVCLLRLVRKKFNPRNCDCRPPCSETVYKYQLSYSTFPDSSSSKLIRKLRNTTIEYQRKNLLAISFYYHATSYSKHEQRESYTFEALLGEVGGNLGLMIGCSVLTAVEVLELFLQLLAGMFQAAYRRKGGKITGTPDSM